MNSPGWPPGVPRGRDPGAPAVYTRSGHLVYDAGGAKRERLLRCGEPERVRPSGRPLLVLLLDGVAYEHVARLWQAGRFRMFRRPARVISVFPTLTDPAYGAFFRCGPTPGYEAGYFDRAQNRLTGAFGSYLRGANECWLRFADYRMGFLQDAFMYLFPRRTFRAELRRARQVVARCLARGRRRIVIYLLSTDGVGHMLRRPEIDELLIEFDGWVRRLRRQRGGALELIVLCDHGMSATPTRRFRLRRRLRRAGLRTVRRLARRGDVALPTFGLLDVARIHAYDEATRDRAVAALAGCRQVELVAWREGQRVGLARGGGRAYVSAACHAGRYRYRYQAVQQDPLALLGRGAASGSGAGGAPVGFAPARAWIAATADQDFPAAVPRLWDGLFRLSAERPDVVVSLAEGWYFGSGLLAPFVRMRGTHGGLHRRVSQTFAMSTSWEFPSPIGLEGLGEVIRRCCGWPAGGAPAVREKCRPAGQAPPVAVE